MAGSDIEARIKAVRAFNRFYTAKIGVLREGLLDSPFPLTEARVLYELARRRQPSASELGRDLGLDAGYLSRILRRFEQRGLVRRPRSHTDRRRSLLVLTAAGRRAFAPLDRRSHDAITTLLGGLSPGEQERLIEAMRAIEALLGERGDATGFVLRTHRPGDLGAIVQLHGAIYAREFGWDTSFEAFVAGIAAAFLRDFEPRCERCWIAEASGRVVGSVVLVRQSKTVAKLRLLIVAPEARGLGIGARLVEECLNFAREAGYRKVTLWTNSVLRAARRLYVDAGFRLVSRQRHRSFGRSLIGEYWERSL